MLWRTSDMLDVAHSFLELIFMMERVVFEGSVP